MLFKLTHRGAERAGSVQRLALLGASTFSSNQRMLSLFSLLDVSQKKCREAEFRLAAFDLACCLVLLSSDER